MNDLDMSKTIEPKSDQLNADDMIAGPMRIKIAKIWGNPDNGAQPVNIGFHGDNGRPYRPCKSMRRVMVHLWGIDGNLWVGRSLTLYRDPTVKFGGAMLGGIRISHASHIDQRYSISLTMSKGKRAPFVIDPMQMDEPKKQEEPKKQDDADTGHTQKADDDTEKLFVDAQSTAAGGTDEYRGWFSGLTTAQKAALQDTMQPDPDDFDQQKSVHDLCKAIASAANF